jgi:hypothetical protein
VLKVQSPESLSLQKELVAKVAGLHRPSDGFRLVHHYLDRRLCLAEVMPRSRQLDSCRARRETMHAHGNLLSRRIAVCVIVTGVEKLGNIPPESFNAAAPGESPCG